MLVPQGNIVLRRDYDRDIAELRQQINELRQLLTEKDEKRPYIKRAEKWMKADSHQS